ncbi:MAG: hypothetical protein ACI4RE_05560 [Christensenellales bacterium]
MVGNPKHETPLLVSVSDFILCSNFAPISTFYLCADVMDEIETDFTEAPFKTAALMSVAFEAGRIQGIREQRAKKRAAA